MAAADTTDDTAADAFADPYLSGINAPVHDELDTGPLPISGDLPAALRGSYLRNGANPAFTPVGRYHPFDGDGMVHAVELADGGARYRNRFVESIGLQAERRAGRALFGGLSEFRLPPPELMAEAGVGKNTANTSVVRHAGRILALMEAARPTELTAELDTVGEHDFGGALRGPMTAHPKIDPRSGEMVFFGYSPTPPFLRLHVADASGRLTESHDIDLPAPVMMHDVAVSQQRVALFDLPAVFDLPSMLAGGEGIRWEPDRGARIGVLDRRALGDGPTWFEVDPFYVFHFLNAYDEGPVMVVEGCRFPRLPLTFGADPVGEAAGVGVGVAPTLHRWRIDTVAGTVVDEPLDDRPADFPRVNDAHAGSATRYGYVAVSRSWADEPVRFDGVVKHDLVAGTATTHLFGPSAVSGEMAFAADPERSDEDAGWLIGFVHDTATDESALVVLDAQAMAEVARVHLPRRVPPGFHGTWMPAPA